MSTGILVLIESREGAVRKGSLETLTLARSLGGRVVAVMSGGSEAVSAVQAYGPAQIVNVRFESPQPSRDCWVAALVELIRREGAGLVLAAATAQGKDVLPGVAAHFERSVAQDVTGLRLVPGGRVFQRPIYAGKAFEEGRLADGVAFVTLRPNVIPAEPASGQAPVEEWAVALPAGRERTQVQEIRATGGSRVELTEASVVVSGGRGIKAPEHFRLIEELAEVLGAAAGASRAVVDAGWVDHQLQVGQTGKTVSPNLYVAVGISGAIQHMAGMSSSKVIVAINKDADAPIFKVADYGIVGDLFQVVPALTVELRKVLQG